MTALKNYVAGYDPASVSDLRGVSAATLSKMGQWFGRRTALSRSRAPTIPTLHAACFVLNAVTGNLGRTVLFLDRAPAPAASRSADVTGW